MLMPNIFDDRLFDNFVDSFYYPNNGKKPYGNHAANIMKTDIKETEHTYEVDIDLPGFKKEEIQFMLENGYITVSAAKIPEETQKETEGKYLHRERYTGNVSRSFYVGNKVQKEEIHPKFQNGVLSFIVPKEQKTVEKPSPYISIEG